jgi:eukaryotic-like serine/threonine-protein kinase
MSAPDIDGYEFLQQLGSGGFADVYLYEQEMPRRTVAIKVLRAGEVGEVGSFMDEANLMAQLSAHPAIVTVHGAGALPDGRPYLVMEHCPRPNLGARFRAETFSVQDALAIGVQIAGAVETAHRAGVLHRDIKPANVLVTGLGRPALADFGIASTLNAAAAGEAVGLSLAWSPPESVDGSWSGPASDVYALGATVYALLASRPPFEAEPNDAASQAARIRRDPLPPTGRSDVPESLEKVFRTAMAKSPQGRYTSALSFARALQKVERELGLPVTTLDVLDGSLGSAASIPADDTMTVRPVTTTGTRPPVTSTTPVPAQPDAPVYLAPAVSGTTTAATAQLDRPVPAADPTRLRGSTADADRTPLRGPTAQTETAPDFGPPPAAPRSKVPGIVLDVVLVLAVAGAAAFYLLT